MGQLIILNLFKSMTRHEARKLSDLLHQPIEKKKSTLPTLRERERSKEKEMGRTVSLRGSAGARKSPRNTPAARFSAE